MSSALLAALFTILGTGLAATSTACLVLWRRVRHLTTNHPIAPKRPSKARSEVARRIDELTVQHRTLEARLAKVETSTAEASPTTLTDPGGNRRGDPAQATAIDGPTLISVPNLSAPPSNSTEAAAELDRRFGPIWGMADEGIPAEAIARETGYPIGQVELILGLRRQLLVAGNGTGAGAALDA